MTTRYSHLFKCLSIILGPLVLATIFKNDLSYSIAIFVSIVTLWFLEIIPLAITGLLVPVLAVVTGELHATEAFSSFGSQILFLFIGSFIMAEAFVKHGPDKRVAFFILSRNISKGSLTRIFFILSFVSYILSMWISNTATAAIMIPICVGLIESCREKIKDKQDFSNFKNRVLLTIAFSSSVGGLATPIGSPPNVLAIEFLKKIDVHLDFLSWMKIGLPLSFIMLLVLNLIFIFRLPVKNVNSEELFLYFQKRYLGLGKIKPVELQVMGVFFVTVFLWTMPGILKNIFPENLLFKAFYKNFPMGVSALIGGISLFFLTYKESGTVKRTLLWKDALKIDWGTILLFGGGLTMGVILSKSGLAEALGKISFSWIDLDQQVLYILVGVFFAIIFSELSSNTASAAIVLPILLSLNLNSSEFIMMATAFGASFGFMLPVSTPPNAMVFGTGLVKLKDMIQNGIIFDIVGGLTIFLYFYLLL